MSAADRRPGATRGPAPRVTGDDLARLRALRAGGASLRRLATLFRLSPPGVAYVLARTGGDPITRRPTE